MTLAILFVIVFHLAVFVVESCLWMRPSIHELALSRLTEAVTVDLHTQALILKPVLVNQGFYNLFLALAGVSGLAALRRGKTTLGSALVGYMCLSALFAGIVLALSTRAYVGALLQALPAALALALLLRARRGVGAVG